LDVFAVTFGFILVVVVVDGYILDQDFG